MKITSAISIALPVLLLTAGCEQAGLPGSELHGNDSDEAVCNLYSIEKINILPLTGFAVAQKPENAGLLVYVGLLDFFGSQMKSPAKFRLELYEHVPRSIRPRGKRVGIWPQVETSDSNAGEGYWFDLYDPGLNNYHWRDFIRAYYFSLPFQPGTKENYILEVTCLLPGNRRITAKAPLKRK